MSVIFGICAPRAAIVDEQQLRRCGEATARYGMDGTSMHVHGQIGMGFQAFHTNDRSKLERRLAVDAVGNILAMDGRLDNHRGLREILDDNDPAVPDSALALKAFERWGENCFSCLVGDWAIALWSARDGILYLARDHAGSRPLYYRVQDCKTMWSSYLEGFFVERSSIAIEIRAVASHVRDSAAGFRATQNVSLGQMLVLNRNTGLAVDAALLQSFQYLPRNRQTIPREPRGF